LIIKFAVAFLLTVGLAVVGVCKSYEMIAFLDHGVIIIVYNIFLWLGIGSGAFISLTFFK